MLRVKLNCILFYTFFFLYDLTNKCLTDCDEVVKRESVCVCERMSVYVCEG